MAKKYRLLQDALGIPAGTVIESWFHETKEAFIPIQLGAHGFRFYETNSNFSDWFKEVKPRSQDGTEIRSSF